MSKRARKTSSILESNSEELRNALKNGEDRGVVDRVRQADRLSPEKRGKIYIWSIICISLALAAFIILRGVVVISEGLTGELVIYDTDISSVEDGTYEGKFTSAHMSAQVSVDIYSGQITAIQLDSYTGIDPQRARTVFDSIITNQSLLSPDDSIGGEYTDKIVERAVMEALEYAVEYSAESRASQAAQQAESAPYVTEAQQL